MRKASKWLLSAGLIALITAAVNKLIFTLAVIKERLFNTKAHYYQWKFGKIYYTVQGQGPAVLLVHNTDADSSDYEYHRIINSLAKHYRVYTLDLLGYGRSEKPKLTYTAYLFVQLIQDFRKDIIRDKVTIITSGKSNAYATMACFQDHAVFRNLIFINPASLQNLMRNPKSQDKAMKLLLETPLLGTAIYNVLFSRKSVANAMLTRIYNPTQIREHFIDTFYESAHTAGSASRFVHGSNLCHFNNVNIIDAIAGINNNVYIIQGRYRMGQDSICEDYKEINPAIECATIDRTKSMPHLEKPESVLEVLSVYLH